MSSHHKWSSREWASSSSGAESTAGLDRNIPTKARWHDGRRVVIIYAVLETGGLLWGEQG